MFFPACSASDDEKGAPGQDHGRTQHLPHAHKAKDCPQMIIGLPNELHEKTDSSVSNKIEAEDEAVKWALPANQPEQQEKKQSFGCRLV